jgi:ABC-type polysaccharide/polyol phosphate export permease
VLWNPEQLQGRMGLVVQLNPLYHLMELLRAPLLGRAPELRTWLVVAASTIVGWALAMYLFGRFRRRIPYWL